MVQPAEHISTLALRMPAAGLSSTFPYQVLGGDASINDGRWVCCTLLIIEMLTYTELCWDIGRRKCIAYIISVVLRNIRTMVRFVETDGYC